MFILGAMSFSDKDCFRFYCAISKLFVLVLKDGVRIQKTQFRFSWPVEKYEPKNSPFCLFLRNFPLVASLHSLLDAQHSGRLVGGDTALSV